MVFGGLRKKFKIYDEITNIGPVIRRYFVIGAFDGALTILGVILGTFAVSPLDSSKPIVYAASVGAGIALAVSSTVGAYEAERVEKKLDQFSVERAMLAEVSQEYKDAYKFAATLSSIIHGVSPLLAALVPIIPFLFFPFFEATIMAIATILILLFLIGAYLGSMVKERFLVTGLRFAAAGMGTALVLFLLGFRP